jgi:outer membrane protein assembly factor BamB
VYLPRFDGSIYALRASNGKVLWSFYLGDAVKAKRGAPPAAAAKPNSCEWDVSSGHALYSPAAVAEDGTLLVGSGEGYLYAIEG